MLTPSTHGSSLPSHLHRPLSIKPSSNLLFGLDRSLLLHVHTVEELSDILVAHLSNGGDERHAVSYLFDIVTFKNDTVLGALVFLDGDSFSHRDATDALLSQEITDLENGGTLDNAVNGEMRVDGTNFVLESFGNSRNHILDVGSDGAKSRKFLLVSEPHVDAKLFALVDLSHLDTSVLEGTLERASLSLDGDFTRIDGKSNCIWMVCLCVMMYRE